MSIVNCYLRIGNSAINNSCLPTQNPAPGVGLAPPATLAPPPGPKTGQSQGRELARGRGWVGNNVLMLFLIACTISNRQLNNSKLIKSKLNCCECNKGIWGIKTWPIPNRTIQNRPIDMKWIRDRCFERNQAEEDWKVVNCTLKFGKRADKNTWIMNSVVTNHLILIQLAHYTQGSIL